MPRPVAIIILTAALLVTAAMLFSRQRTEAGIERVTYSVMCAKCGLEAEWSPRQLSEAQPAGVSAPNIGPDFGPGGKCPKCGENAVYQGPVKCRSCETKFFRSWNKQYQSFDLKCPKCGTEG